MILIYFITLPLIPAWESPAFFIAHRLRYLKPIILISSFLPMTILTRLFFLSSQVLIPIALSFPSGLFPRVFCSNS